jgi:AcrR family transcriptional regulator
MKVRQNTQARWLDDIADHILANGLGSSSLRALAKAAGTSDRMLLYYFTDKAELIGAALETIAARTIALLVARAAPKPQPFAAVLTHFAGLIYDAELLPHQRLFLEIASRSANGDPVYRTVGERLGRGFHAWCMAQIESEDRDADAARLLVTMEGVVFLSGIGLRDVCEAALGLKQNGGS